MRHGSSRLSILLPITTLLIIPATAAAEESAVRAALGRQAYPWYDPQSDRVIPPHLEPSSWQHRWGDWTEAFFRWLDGRFGGLGGRLPGVGLSGLGNALTTALFLASGALLIFILWRLWRQHEPGRLAPPGSPSSSGLAARVAGLPEVATFEGVDPWDEALRLRASGDRAGAMIWLFVAQLILLERAGLARLTPGRTARQYVRGLERGAIRDDLAASLSLFEDAYYGHLIPAPESLDGAWARAEDLRRRIAALRSVG